MAICGVTVTAAANAPALRALLDALVATATASENLTERRALVNAVVDEGHAIRAHLARPEFRAELAALEGLRADGSAQEGARVPDRVLVAAFAVSAAHLDRYRKSLDYHLLVAAICASALEAGRGVTGRPGTVRAGRLPHLGTLTRLVAAADLKPNVSGIREEYAAARARNVALREAIQSAAGDPGGPEFSPVSKKVNS